MNLRILYFIFIFFVNVSNVFSQNDTLSIQYFFEKYNSNNYQEKAFLHTDKTVYTTGEIIWFKAYITNANSNTLSSLSTICYVEIISEDKRSLLQAKIDIDSGTGSGSFIIPSSIRTGNYIIRAYTNWMKNFDASFYFAQPLTIINPNKKPEIITKDTSSNLSVQFFPEGGNLVYGLNNTLAFKLTDEFGSGLTGKGIIVNDKNETIVSFEPQHFGMGSFSFTPVKGNKYHAIIHAGNKTFTSDLPKIYDNGWVLHVKDNGNDLLVNVECNVAAQQNVFLFAQTKHLIKYAKSQPLNNGSANFIISKSEIGEGISQLTVFNDSRQPVCERLYFKRPTDFLQIKLNTFKQNFQQRKKVSLSISAKDINGQPSESNLSISVYLIDSLQPEQQINLLNYLWLSSDLKGEVESPQYYFENSGTEVDKATDNLMLTQGWRRFKWEDVLKNTAPAFSFLPEHEGHIITGKLLPVTAGLPLNGITANLSVPGKYFKFSVASSSSSGIIKFNVQKFYGSHELIAQTEGSNYRVLIDNPFSIQYPQNKIRQVWPKQKFSKEILLRSIGAQSQNIYQPQMRAYFNLPAAFDTIAFFGNPSKTYFLDEYTRFPTTEEVMREYVKEVIVKRKEKNFHYELFNEAEKNYFNDDPLILIDGVPVSINKIMEIDPLKIKKIDLVTARFFKDDQTYDGIINYSTYNNDLDGYLIDPAALVVEYEGLQLQREFYSPDYQTPKQQASRLPDYRNVLYWSPNVKTVNGKQDISFYTSDVPGKYIVLVQGISATGFAGFASSTLIIEPFLK